MQNERGDRVATIARECGYITDITHDIEFDDPRVRGRFWYGIKEIEIRTDPADFPGYRTGPALAHELGHAVYHGMTRPVEYHETPPPIFETDSQRVEARTLSERLHGPIYEPDAPGISNYRTDDEELFAEVFACRIIEPEAARRIGPGAVDRIEELLETHLTEPLFE